ncbi:phosphatidate phosphatase LPIN3 isoform X1 [Diorhabda sublineata]|uniref:phosphatidate phosphatase LPIN3 isoform X1 n=1 Tax=Diorhabda sublineata TaxID=1163346 RepID=UPI0024E0BF39|nr:phosphatidate phosphatase LPIN3 isoform X1 [Diorhabda sublineata]XP_056634367.1 phosphatidate phosphatase LPIN3 isoform X1 [Diorhabda sublineata]XP_056634368.1 phosphatidate phosphatase LPIN3 isoform X1 [Diorhabda sublineata]XP_056634369.1 phosphatidate phosphatase LPIN3 isoform X1 [Diorhabda sublineata]
MHGMMKIFSNFKDFYNDINGATLTGAIDVIVVEQQDGSFNCSPFHVRFGKLGVLRSREKVVDIEINGEPQEIHMKLGESGEAFFVEELEDDDDEEIPEHLATSPIPVSEFENMFKKQGRRLSLEDISNLGLENEANDYKTRRNTADNENSKTRERNFIRRQLVLGNLEINENSAEEMTLSMISGKHSSEDLSKSHNDISETIFKMDSLDIENSKAEELKSENIAPVSTATYTKSTDDPSTESKSSKKRRKRLRRKNAPKKSSSINQISASQASENLENNDTITDRSSLDSNGSEPDLKEIQSKSRNNEDILRADTSNIKKIDADFHFFSDTELTKNGNVDSRAASPVNVEAVLSDTEFEVKGRKDDLMDGAKSWEWGGFPSVSQTNSPASDKEHRSMLSGMFSFMKQKHGTQNPLEGGIYLSEITSGTVNQEVAQTYFSTSKERKEVEVDCESGNGPSLTQSPNSADGCKSIDSDFEDQNKFAQTFSQDISLSMCGWEPEPNCNRFLEKVVKFSDLCNNPILFENPDLVVRIKDKYYTWKVAAPIITSIMVYGRPLVQSSVDQLCNIHMPNRPAAQELKEEGPKQEIRRSWWRWSRGATSRETTPASENVNIKKVVDTKQVVIEKGEHVKIKENDKLEESDKTESFGEQINIPRSPNSSFEKYRKTLRLTSKQIASLNLRDGLNEVEFSVTTAYQGTTRCQCHLYKWKWDDKIVVSDIDGTITKSDVLGHILPIVGKDWAQTGVAQLFNKIEDNGYKLLYLSARAIGQARITRDYLKSIKQGNLSMPDGPILLNPTSLITAFHREVIERKPEQFKISCMSDIKALFPVDSNPFYAGYGNRINDVWAYRAVGIPIVRIFTINPKGELKHELTQTFQSSYSGQSLVVNDVFPPILNKINLYDTDGDSDYVDDSDSESSSFREN